jgi:TPR repeat protein
LGVIAVVVFAVIALRPYLFGPPEGATGSEQASGVSQPASSADASAPAAAAAKPQAGGADDPVYDQAKASFDSKQYAQARTLFSQDCDGGGLKGCDYLGYLYAQGLGGAQDAEKAAGVFLKACTGGNLSSCASLGSLYEDAGNGTEARTYYQKACDGGLAESCKLLRGVQ